MSFVYFHGPHPSCDVRSEWRDGALVIVLRLLIGKGEPSNSEIA